MSAPSHSPTSHLRTNTVIAAWACLVTGAGVILGVPGDPFALALGTPIAIAGVILLFIGLGMKTESSINPEKVAAWAPDAVPMPDAGRAMYRIDTSLDPPIRSSILCGRCGHLEWVDGSKPSSYDCADCRTPLWIAEEE